MAIVFPPSVVTERDVTALSAFKTSAKSAYFLEIGSKGDLPALSEAVAAAKSAELPVAFLGDGTNCLFAFDRFPGLLVKNSLSGFRYLDGVRNRVEDGEDASVPCRFEVGSAEKVHSVALIAATRGERGFLPWVGLPGSFGGAVVGNAGCFGLETADVLVSAEVWDLESGRLETLSNADLAFAYRTSALKRSVGRFVVSAVFDLSLRKSGNLFEEMDVQTFRELRRAKQPAGRTCGSFFKNPEGQSAGSLIDRAGLKGAKIGGAEISTLHANFFLASAGAAWSDVTALRDLAKSSVLSTFGIELVEEARIITERG